MDIRQMSVENMAGLKYTCGCGRTHSVEIKNIRIGSGAVCELAGIIKDMGIKNILLVADKNTYAAAGEKVYEILKHSFNVKTFIFPEEKLTADERAIGRLLVETTEDIGLIIALGSGTVNDISRFISSKTGIPYIIVCTAPSMDGYSSIVSPLIVDGVKTTYNAVYPYGIIADIDILKDAPLNMLHAGFGDIIGKYTALSDWKLAHILNGEYYCRTIAMLVTDSIEKCANAAPGLNKREPKGVQAVTEALILSGICIGMAGTSRPASGEEHHISHCLEMVWMNQGTGPKWLHGNNVGVGCVIISELYKYLHNVDINQVYNSKKYIAFDKEKWAKNLVDVFEKGAQRVMNLKEDMIVLNESEREKTMRNIMDKWELLRELFASAVSPDTIRDMLKQLGAPSHPEELGVDRELFIKTLVAAKDVRRRYGILQLLEDMGLLEEAALAVAEKYY